jgi:hypothetical protein
LYFILHHGIFVADFHMKCEVADRKSWWEVPAATYVFSCRNQEPKNNIKKRIEVGFEGLKGKALFHQLVDVASCCLYRFHGCFAQSSPSFHRLTFSSRFGLGTSARRNTCHEETPVTGSKVDEADLTYAATAGIPRSSLFAHGSGSARYHATTRGAAGRCNGPVGTVARVRRGRCWRNRRLPRLADWRARQVSSSGRRRSWRAVSLRGWWDGRRRRKVSLSIEREVMCRRSVARLWHVNHEARRIGIVDLIFVRQLGVLGMHGKVEVGILLLLGVNNNILAILIKEIQIPPSTLMSVLSHVLMSRPCFGC